MSHIEDETDKGEYYLDSIGVLAEFRGEGVGRALLIAAAQRAFAEGYKRVGLIVDYDNAEAERLHASLGFRRVVPMAQPSCSRPCQAMPNLWSSTYACILGF